VIVAPKGPPWWRPFARKRWRRALELPADLPRQIALQVAEDSASLGLLVTGDCSAADLLLLDGVAMRWLVPRTTAERSIDADPAAIRAAAARMLEEVARRHGPGRVWTLPGLEIVHPAYDDGMLVRLGRGNRPIVVLRAVYFHEATAIAAPKPRPIELEPWTT